MVVESKALKKYLEVRSETVNAMVAQAVDEGRVEVVTMKKDLDFDKGQIKYSDLTESLVRIGAKGMETRASTGQFAGQLVGEIKLGYLSQGLTSESDNRQKLARIVAVATKDAIDTYKYLLDNFQLVSDDLSAELYVQRKQAFDDFE